MRKLIVFSVVVLTVVALAPDVAEARTRLIYNVIGMHGGRPANTANGEPTGATCFDVDLQDPHTGQTIGTATDCLANITPVGGGLSLVGTTFFKLPGGTIVTQGNTTVQPTTTNVASSLATFSHITGANGTGNAVIGGTGRFRKASGTARLSGQVDLVSIAPGIIFDCIFIIDLDTPHLR